MRPTPPAPPTPQPTPESGGDQREHAPSGGIHAIGRGAAGPRRGLDAVQAGDGSAQEALEGGLSTSFVDAVEAGRGAAPAAGTVRTATDAVVSPRPIAPRQASARSVANEGGAGPSAPQDRGHPRPEAAGAARVGGGENSSPNTIWTKLAEKMMLEDKIALMVSRGFVTAEEQLHGEPNAVIELGQEREGARIQERIEEIKRKVVRQVSEGFVSPEEALHGDPLAVYNLGRARSDARWLQQAESARVEVRGVDERRRAALVARMPESRASLQRVIDEVAKRPAPTEGTAEPSQLHAGDLEGPSVRACARLPAIMFARSLPEIYYIRGLATSLEVLSNLTLPTSEGLPQRATEAIFAAMGPCLNKSVPDVLQLLTLAKRVEARLDQDELDTSGPMGGLVKLLLQAVYTLQGRALIEVLSLGDYDAPSPPS